MRDKDRSAKAVNAAAERTAGNILLCFFAAFGVCFFTPMDIFFANADDIAFPFKPLAIVMGIVTLAVFAVLFLMCTLIKGRANKVFRAILFGAALAFYIQGNFLAINMGQLDGTKYEMPVWKAALNIVIWLAILAVPFIFLIKFPNIFDKVVSYVPGAIIVIQIVALVASFYLNVNNFSNESLEEVFHGDDTRWIHTVKDLDVYSENHNFIVIVADMYDSFYFDNAVAEEPDTVSEFDGFTYYTNTVGRFTITDPSIAYILSGSEENEYSNRTLFNILAENYRANYYSDPNIPPSSVLAEYSDNIVRKKITLGETYGYAKGIYKISFFRCMPEVLKPLFWSSGNLEKELDSKTVKRMIIDGYPVYSYFIREFYDEMPRELQTVDEKVFKFMYMLGIHYPRTVTRDLEVVPESADISPAETAIAVNKILNEYLKMLKDNDMYDNSDIIIMADHGISDHNKFPMLMYKPAHQTETGIKISNAPISYEEMFPTLVMLAGGEPNGRTIFDIAEDEERVRHFETANEDFTGNIKDVRQ